MTSADREAHEAEADAWRELQRIADGALDLPPHERLRFVDEACGADVALRARVRQLLDDCERAERQGGVLDTPAAAFAEPVVDEVAAQEADAAARREQLQATLRAALADRYAVERELARGGMATVFLARDLRHDRAVAIKVLDPDRVARSGAARFQREIRTAAGMTHPHVLSVFDSGEARGLLYYVMPYVEGETLRARLTREGALPLPFATRLLRELADALAFAHARGIVHRDVKPENVLLAGEHAVVADFGIARAVAAAVHDVPAQGAALTGAGIALGTPAYMAPEQVAGDAPVDHRADLYALGVVAYEVLAGSHPFAGRTSTMLMVAQLRETPEPLVRRRADVPSELATLVMRLLEKAPADRPQSAEDVVRALDALGGAVRDGAAPQPARATSRRLRGRRRPIAIAAVLGLAAAALVVVALTRDTPSTRREPAAPAGASSVAVLPFANVGRDTLTEYFADGMTHELATALARTPGVHVAGRRSSSAFKDSSVAVTEIGRTLGVRFVLEGSVRRAGDRVRVSAQLTNVADGRSAWSGSFDGAVRDVFALQDSITGAIVGALRLTLAAPPAAPPRSLRTSVLEAHDLYLQGRYEAGKHTREGLLRAIALFERAAALDSTYALPLVGMADAYGWLADSYYPAHQAYAQARTAVTRALRLAPDLAEAHAVLGWIQLAYDWDGRAAARTLRRAVSLDSLSPLAHSNYAYALWSQRDSAGALRHMRRAIALDPLWPALSANLEWHLLMQRRYAEVIEQHRLTSRLDSTYFFADSWVGIAYRELGRYDDAIAEYRAASARQGGQPMPGLAITHARMGDSTRARRELVRLLDHARRAHVQPDAVAQVYAALGDADRAFEWLERAFQARSNSLAWLEFHPALDPLRSDPRFIGLVRRVNGR